MKIVTGLEEGVEYTLDTSSEYVYYTIIHKEKGWTIFPNTGGEIVVSYKELREFIDSVIYEGGELLS